jgi:hypothetical protein
VKPTEAETVLLGLAREIGALGESADAVGAAVRVLASAYAPQAVTARAVHTGWLASRGDKTRALALAWAREQVRMALQDVIERDRRRARVEAGAETRAWLLLAACESLAHEPPAAVADRVRALLALTGHAETDG